MPQRTAGDWGSLLTLVLIWGTAFLFIDLSVETLPPATLVAVRVGVAAFVLVATCLALGLRLPGWGKIWGRFLTLAVVGNAVPFFAISWGQERITSGQAGILMAVMPLSTLVLAHFFVADERMTLRRVAGFTLGFMGIVVLTGPDALARLGGAPSDIVRQLAVLGGALCYAVNTILARRMPETHPIVSSTAVMLMASAVMLPAAAWLDVPWTLEPSAVSVNSAIWLGVVPTAVATVLYFRIVGSAGPTFLSLINYLIPIVALVTGVLALSEALEWRAVGALVLVLGGLWTSQRGEAVRAV
jgi:drug/metabolite transporter (DMT)-like permease